MATENDIVRITHRELEDYADKHYNNGDKGITKDKKQKRPSMQIYRPGAGSVRSKNTTDDVQESVSPVPDAHGNSAGNFSRVLQNNEESNEKEDKNVQSKKKKRPEVALYVPRNRVAGGDTKTEPDISPEKNISKHDNKVTARSKSSTNTKEKSATQINDKKDVPNSVNNKTVFNPFKIAIVKSPENPPRLDRKSVEKDTNYKVQNLDMVPRSADSVPKQIRASSEPKDQSNVGKPKDLKKENVPSKHSYSQHRRKHYSSGSSKSSSQEEDDVNSARAMTNVNKTNKRVDLNISVESSGSEGPVLNWAAEMEEDAHVMYEYANPKCTEGKVDDFRQTVVEHKTSNEIITNSHDSPIMQHSISDTNNSHVNNYKQTQSNTTSVNRTVHQPKFNNPIKIHKESNSSDSDYNNKIDRKPPLNEISRFDSVNSDSDSGPFKDYDFRKRSTENLDSDGYRKSNQVQENEFPGNINRRPQTRHRTRSDRSDSDQERSSEIVNIHMRNRGQRQILSRGNSSDELNNQGRKSPAGLLHLPPNAPIVTRPSHSTQQTHDTNADRGLPPRGKQPQRQLFNPNNPSRPIVVDTHGDIRDPQLKTTEKQSHGRQNDSAMGQNQDYKNRHSADNRAQHRSDERMQHVNRPPQQNRSMDNRSHDTRLYDNRSPNHRPPENDARSRNSQSRDNHSHDSRSYDSRSHDNRTPDKLSRDDRSHNNRWVDNRSPNINIKSRTEHDHRQDNIQGHRSPIDPARGRLNDLIVDQPVQQPSRESRPSPVDARFMDPRQQQDDQEHIDPAANYTYPSGQPPPPANPMLGYPMPNQYGQYPSAGPHDAYPRVPNMPYNPYHPYIQQFPGQHPYNRYPAPYDYMQPHAIAEHMLCQAMLSESQLTQLVARRQNDPEYFSRLDAQRFDLRGKYEQILLNDADFAMKHNIDQQLWKSVYYQVIETLRKMMADQPTCRPYLLNVFNEGTEYYQSLLHKLQTKFGFSLEDHLSTSPASPVHDNVSRSVKLALMSAQRTLICLGDIARYHEQMHDAMNYGKARSWYIKAQQIAPKNGRPYNQLAILAIYTKRKFDAVYYYMRSLAASNPFLTARECLMGMFEETRKKAEFVEKERLEEKERVRKLRRRQKEEGPRVEVWIRDDGMSREEELLETYEEDLHKLLPIDLHKRVTLSFLNVHGKLFTKIGMEQYSMVVTQLCQEVQVLLSHNPPTISSERLLQILAVNMFAIDNTALKNAQDLDPSICRGLQQEQCVQMSLDMFSLILATSTSILSHHISSPAYPATFMPQHLDHFLPAIKVWMDWMICHETLWNPMPTVAKEPDSFVIDVWETVARFCNVVKDVDISHVTLLTDKQDGCECLVLPEDQTMAGFVPLLSAPNDPVYILEGTNEDLACQCLRIQKLQIFSEYLCGVEPPMLAYNVEKGLYYSVCPSQDIASEEIHAVSEDLSNQNIASTEQSDDEMEIHGGGELNELRRRKRELQKKVENQARTKETREAILNEHRKQRLILEICPTFLVPDTNCFIKHLRLIMKIVQRHKYIIVVPLVVINELDGLCLGGARGHYDSEHAQSVTTQAQEAIKYLEAQFDAGNKYLLALTSKGTTMTTIDFRSEESTDHAVNDDRILECCLHYCKDKARDFMNKHPGEAIRLKRDVVLLTDDRNLRLKAHTNNVPVKDVPAFWGWSQSQVS